MNSLQEFESSSNKDNTSINPITNPSGKSFNLTTTTTTSSSMTMMTMSSASSSTTTTSSPPSTPSRYENQKRRDWNTFGQYLRNHRPPLSLSRCSGAHVLEFLRYLDQFGKTNWSPESGGGKGGRGGGRRRVAEAAESWRPELNKG